jgi:hypothetical protein
MRESGFEPHFCQFTNNIPGTMDTIFTISGIFFLNNFLVGLSGKTIHGAHGAHGARYLLHHLKNIHNPPSVTCPDRFRSAAIRSCSFLNRRPDQYRSSPDFPSSITPISRSAAKSLFLEMCCRYPSSSHHRSNTSFIAMREIRDPGSATNSVARNKPTVSLTVRKFPVATDTLRGCTSLPPFS